MALCPITKMPLLLFTFSVLCGRSLSEKLVDLSHDLAADSIRWPTSRSFEHIEISKGYQPNGNWYEAYDVSFGEHISTHIDAPSHYHYAARTVDQIPVQDLVAPAVVIDIQAKAASEPNAALSTDDLLEWMEEHGPIPDGAVLFVRTGWGHRYHNKSLYFGTGTDDPTKFAFPGISEGAAQLLTGYADVSGHRIVGVAIDTASLDPGNATNLKTHQELAKHNIYGIENVANLEQLPVTGAEVTVLPLKIRGGSGAPCRVLARIPDTSDALLTTCPSLLVLTAAVMVMLLQA
uniref:Kynurenine formamidase-like n=2 Tax=Hirondellea gigas TaxID=1518452 RepID=A0A2P2HZP9_9CRUS